MTKRQLPKARHKILLEEPDVRRRYSNAADVRLRRLQQQIIEFFWCRFVLSQLCSWELCCVPYRIPPGCVVSPFRVLGLAASFCVLPSLFWFAFSIFDSSRKGIFSIQGRIRYLWVVDRTEFESVTPRVQGGYTTRLYYRPTREMAKVQILIVVFLARILFENKITITWYF